MNSIGKILFLSFVAVILASCSAATVRPTQTPQLTATFTPKATITATLLPPTGTTQPSATFTPPPSATATLMPPTGTAAPTLTPSPTLPAAVTPVSARLEDGLTWTECAVPVRDYSRGDMRFLEQCAAIPELNADDKNRRAERVEVSGGFSEFHLTIGSDHYATWLDFPGKSCCQYELLLNGEVILSADPGFTTYDPNVSLWNFEGKFVWELSGSFRSDIFVGGVSYNTAFGLQAAYMPYEINGKLIFVAVKDGQYHIVYNGRFIGPEFDDLSITYCCSMISLYYGSGQYWFVGRRGGTKYVVLIHG
jgi:hypothetical protein